MSDETAVAAPEVATTEPVAPAGNTPAEVKQNARTSVHDLGTRFAENKQRAQEARRRAVEQPRGEGGQFAATEATEAVGESTAEVVPEVPDASAEGATEPGPSDGPPEGMVRIEYPEGHPLRDQGETYIDVPAAQERSVRTMVNASARRREAEDAQRLLAEERRQRLRLDAELRFVREKGSEFWTAEHQQRYDDILNTYGQEDAEAYKAGQLSKSERAMEQVRSEADLQAVAAQWQDNGRAFRTEAHQVLPTLVPGVTPQEIETAIGMYRAELETLEAVAMQQAEARGVSRHQFLREFAEKIGYSGQDFFAVAGDYLRSRPGVQQFQSRNNQAEELQRRKIEADIAAKQREELIAASKRHAGNPQRALGGVSTGSRTTDTNEKPDMTGMSSEQIKRSFRDEVRSMGERLASRAGR